MNDVHDDAADDKAMLDNPEEKAREEAGPYCSYHDLYNCWFCELPPVPAGHCSSCGGPLAQGPEPWCLRKESHGTLA